MHPLKRLMVGIDQSPADDILIRFCAVLAQQAGIDKIYVIHAAKNLELPEQILEKYPDLIAPVDENIRLETGHLLDKYFPPELKARTEIIILEGNPIQVVLKEIVVKEIDLLVVGKRSKPNSTGIFARKMALLANCSVAILSPEADMKPGNALFRNPLVPVDFSEHSILALEMLKLLAGKSGQVSFNCLHVYRVPIGYHYSGKSYEEFARIMEDNAREQMERTLKRAGLEAKNVTQIFTLDENQNIPYLISWTIDQNQFDFIIIGSKGRTAAASFLLGSNTEKLIDESNISMIVVKDKGNNLQMIDALLKL